MKEALLGKKAASVRRYLNKLFHGYQRGLTYTQKQQFTEKTKPFIERILSPLFIADEEALEDDLVRQTAGC